MLQEHPRRRDSIPQELEDPEDSTMIGPAQGEFFERNDDEYDNSTNNNNNTEMSLTRKATTNMSTSSPLVVALPQPTPVVPSTPTTTSSSSGSIGSSNNVSDRNWMQQIPRELRSLLAGGIAGMVAKSVVAPMDRIKILYQVSSAEFHFRNLPQVIRNIVETEGIWALWRGNTATMIRVFPYSGIQFMVFDRCKRFFLHEHEHHGRYLTTRTTFSFATAASLSSSPSVVPPSFSTLKAKHGLTPVESLLGGMVAGTVSVVCTYPLDLTRAQLAVLKAHKRDPAAQSTSAIVQNKGFVSVFWDNYRQRGVMGLFRGISPTIMGILPYSGVAFTLNEQGKREIQNITKRDITTMERMQCGALSGLFAQSVAYPIEVVRRRMQTLGFVSEQDSALSCLGDSKNNKKNNSSSSNKVSGTTTTADSLLSTIRHLYAEQGMRGFFKGVSVNWMKGPIAFSISFTTFDVVQGWLEPPHHNNSHDPKATTNTGNAPSQSPQQQQQFQQSELKR